MKCNSFQPDGGVFLFVPLVMLLLTLASDILVALPPAGAQSAGRTARVGVIGPGSPPSEVQLQRSPFRQALHELGWVEGKNIAFESRFAEGNLDRLPALAAELVRLKVDLIVASGAIAIRAAQHATSTIPIVMAPTADPVRAGFVASLARPSGNITGVSDLVADLSPKRLELLKEAGPGISRVAVLADPANPYTPAMVSETEQAARALGVQLHILEITDPNSLEPAFVTITTERADALVVLPAARFGTHARRITDLVAQYHLPAIYPSRGFVEVGGLMSYGTNNTELLRRAATYVDKILKGTKPADLPVEQPMKFEFVINLKTAQALGFPIPPSILFQADEVIK
jgi:putative ABC transport system substrate-binding protein